MIDICPACNSYNIKYGYNEISKVLYRIYFCDECGFSWKESLAIKDKAKSTLKANGLKLKKK